MTPSIIASATRRVFELSFWRISAARAMMPPSPSLSARRISATYFTDTTSVTDQKISEITPSTSELVGLTACPSMEKTVCIA